MPLQNRVNPLGNIIQTPHRGAWTGNRGVIHNDKKQVIRSFKSKAWITCALEFKGMKRVVMSPNRWTELFFLDEATAFAAGHRPCAYCRRADFNQFKALWLKANKDSFELTDEKMTTIDIILHKERLEKNSEKKHHFALLFSLPDGVIFCFKNDKTKPFLIYKNYLFEWHESGYLTAMKMLEIDVEVSVLTPLSIVNVFKQNYVPQIDNSAMSLLLE